MIELEEAIQRLCNHAHLKQEVIQLPVLNARGHVLAQDVVAQIPVPGFARSGMDGYAVNSKNTVGASNETPVVLTVQGEVCAGDDKNYTFTENTAVRIMTGGAIPDGYDCVIKQEDTNMQFPTVEIYKQMKVGENYCEAGEDIALGKTVLQKGTKLTSHHIGILASLGYAVIEVLKPIQVGIISTGNELATLGTPLKKGQIYNSNSYAIAACIEAAGFHVPFIEICPDEVEVFCEKVNSMISSVDILLTTGAVSVGKKDILPEAINTLGAKLLFKKVNMKPGTPILASLYKQKIILSMSGNPFAAMVNFHLFFWPIATKIMGSDAFKWKRKKMILCEGAAKSNTLRRFLRAYADDNGVHIYTRKHFASVFSNLSESNCIIDQPPNVALQQGDEVTIIYWG